MNTTSTIDDPSSKPKPMIRYLTATVRILMGLMFFVFGLNAFVDFIPQPKEPMPEAVMAFMGGMMKTGYMLKLIGATEMATGALLLLNRFVPLALALIAPVVVNILAFHMFLFSQGMIMALIVVAMEAYLTWAYWSAFRPMLAARHTPGA